MRYMVVVTNAKSLSDFGAHKTYHFVEANTPEEAQKQALLECTMDGPHGIPFKSWEKVHVDRCLKQNAGEQRTE